MSLWRREQRETQPEAAEVGDAIVDELSRLRDIATPPALVASVMGKIEARPAPSFWAWLHKPVRLAIRVSPAGMVGLLSTVVAGVVLFQMSPRVQPIPMSIAVETATQPAPTPATVVAPRPQPAPATVQVRFALRDSKAQKVAVTGSFNGWNQKEIVLHRATSAGLFTATVALPPGEHEYMFVVDGNFTTDPDAATHRPDGFGNMNALLRL